MADHHRLLKKLPSGCAALDDLLDGGIERAAMTELFGEAGSGKTNFCLQVARNCVREGKKAIYIDTEGISLERLRQICGDEFDHVLNNLILFDVHSVEEQGKGIDKAVKLASKNPDIGLVVLDSMIAHFRLCLGEEGERDLMRTLSQQAMKLLSLARNQELPVVVTNQVFTNIETGSIERVCGFATGYISKAIIKLEKRENGRREATIMKHRSVPEGRHASFTIQNSGLI